MVILSKKSHGKAGKTNANSSINLKNNDNFNILNLIVGFLSS